MVSREFNLQCKSRYDKRHEQYDYQFYIDGLHASSQRFGAPRAIHLAEIDWCSALYVGQHWHDI